ncbi:MAG: exodeoxyribonuclease VII small subunit [Oceanobacter sp.]
MSQEAPFDFERALKDLETLVARMESGDLTLDESLKSFEQGIQLTRSCQQALTKAEQRVRILIDENGESLARPFEETGND